LAAVVPDKVQAQLVAMGQILFLAQLLLLVEEARASSLTPTQGQTTGLVVVLAAAVAVLTRGLLLEPAVAAQPTKALLAVMALI
jgi:hypothetical protein